MSGRLVDLADPHVAIPDPVVVDTNVVVAWMLTSQLSPDPLDASRARGFFHALIAEGRRAILTPTAYGEVLHVSIRARYQHELRTQRDLIAAKYGARITSWTELAKRDPSILREHATELEQLRQRLVAANVVIAGAEDLGSIPSGRPFQEELVRYIGRYGLDTSDAAILLEAARLGVNAIVSTDLDLRRALDDFDIYTWP